MIYFQHLQQDIGQGRGLNIIQMCKKGPEKRKKFEGTRKKQKLFGARTIIQFCSPSKIICHIISKQILDLEAKYAQ